MRAVISGLLGLTAACDGNDVTSEENDPDSKDDRENACGPSAGKAGSGGKAGSSAAAGSGSDAGGGDDAATDGGTGHTGSVNPGDEPEKELSTKDVQLTFKELSSMCESRKGYLEIHASCSGVNSCQGFFYGDWDEDSQLIEHTCAGVNGCAGLSCLIPSRQEDEKPDPKVMTGEEVMKLDDAWYEKRAGVYGAKPCRQCHTPSEFNEEMEEYVYDHTKLKIVVWPKDGLTADNWTQKQSAAYQEHLVAFGARGITADGVVYSHMASYAKLLSKEEIQNVVKYMRGFDPKNIVVKEIKVEPGKVE